jgi:integrase
MFPQGFPMILTNANIGLPEGKTDAIYFDSELSGFGLRLRRGSDGRINKNWIIVYRVPGHQRRMIIGDANKVTAAEARKRARKELSKVELGGDPQSDKKERRDKDDVTLRSVIADFLHHKTGVKSGTMRMLRTYLGGPLYVKPLHGVPIDRITRKDISARLLAVSKENGVPTAIALRGALSTLFSWAMQMGLIEHNPVISSFKPPRPEPRDRVLADSELAAIWRGLNDDDYGKIIKLLILTGCRREEIGRMRWSEFASDMSTWTLAKERSKTGKPHTVPVTSLIREVIDSVPRREGFDLLFGRRCGFTRWSIDKVTLDAKLGLKRWVVHDIRRSVATGMANIGIQPHIVEQVLNHQSGHRRGVAGVYNRSPYEREVRAALALWSDHVRAVVAGDAHKVVAFPQAAILERA